MKNIDTALIYGLWNEYAAAINAGDVERWMSLWVDDGLQMAPNSPTRVGKEQIFAAQQTEVNLYETRSVVIHIEEVSVIGDWAYSHGRYEVEMTSKDRGMIKSCSGNFLDILMKRADGSWRIVIDCRNYSQPSRKNGVSGSKSDLYNNM